MSNVDAIRCEDDFRVLACNFTDLCYNTIYDISIAKSESNSNITLKDLYVSTLKKFATDIKNPIIFKKIMIQFINSLEIHTNYRRLNYDANIYRLFSQFIITKTDKYTSDDQVKFLQKLFVNTYSKFITKIIESYLDVILFDRQNIKYHKELQNIFYEILINEKKIFYSALPVEYNNKIDMINLVNDHELLKTNFMKQEQVLEKMKNALIQLKVENDKLKEECNKYYYIAEKLAKKIKSETPETPETPKPETPKPETPETPKPETPETPKPETPETPKPETPELMSSLLADLSDMSEDGDSSNGFFKS